MEILNRRHMVEYLIRDNGPGIPEDISAKVFDPFFTTKPDGAGTGLGLSLSRDIMKRLGGALELAPGDEGTCFVVRLPSVT